MLDLVALQPVDYLVVGHVSIDKTSSGGRLGGTAAYSSLTAQALGLKVGIVTSAAADVSLQELSGIHVVSVPALGSTTYENITTPEGRMQILHHVAAPILLENIPQVWRTAPIVHLAPIANEMDASLASQLSASLLGITPQGWMRRWDSSGRVSLGDWEQAGQVLPHASAVIVSLEDLGRNLEKVEGLAHQTRLLCVTEGAAGAVVYWNGDRRRFHAPRLVEVDSTGAGDIFAAVFFVRLYATRDPWEAARFATQLASRSITRPGLQAIPTPREIDECLMEVLS